MRNYIANLIRSLKIMTMANASKLILNNEGVHMLGVRVEIELKMD